MAPIVILLFVSICPSSPKEHGYRSRAGPSLSRPPLISHGRLLSHVCSPEAPGMLSVCPASGLSWKLAGWLRWEHNLPGAALRGRPLDQGAGPVSCHPRPPRGQQSSVSSRRGRRAAAPAPPAPSSALSAAEGLGWQLRSLCVRPDTQHFVQAASPHLGAAAVTRRLTMGKADGRPGGSRAVTVTATGPPGPTASVASSLGAVGMGNWGGTETGALVVTDE